MYSSRIIYVQSLYIRVQSPYTTSNIINCFEISRKRIKYSHSVVLLLISYSNYNFNVHLFQSSISTLVYTTIMGRNASQVVPLCQWFGGRLLFCHYRESMTGIIHSPATGEWLWDAKRSYV